MIFLALVLLFLFVTGNYGSVSMNAKSCDDNNDGGGGIMTVSPKSINVSGKFSPQLSTIVEEVTLLELLGTYKEFVDALKKESSLKDLIISDLRTRLSVLEIELSKVQVINQSIIDSLEYNHFKSRLKSDDSCSDAAGDAAGLVCDSVIEILVGDCAAGSSCAVGSSCAAEEDSTSEIIADKTVKKTVRKNHHLTNNRFNLFSDTSSNSSCDSEDLKMKVSKAPKKKKEKKKRGKGMMLDVNEDNSFNEQCTIS